MEWIIGAILLLYVLVVLLIWVAWQKLPCHALKIARHSPTLKLTVLVAARNEAKNIRNLLTALAQQTYPRENFEVVLINDHSTDQTQAQALQVAQELHLTNFRCLSLATSGAAKGKKAAIAAGIEAAVNPFICTTDADCSPGPEWLSTMAKAAESTNAVFISGPVCYQPGATLLEQLQAVEFAGLIGIGAATIALKQPTMCNGANLLFSKEAFYKVGGYQGNEQVASGDDEFLLHKIAAAYPMGYTFLKAREAIVYTQPKTSWQSLLQQRIRWAGKWKHYTRNSPKLLSLFIFLVYGSLLAALVLALAGSLPWLYLVSAICVKFVAEAVFFLSVLRFFKLGRLLWLVAVLQFVYPPFVLLVALATLKGTYHWKGRTVRAS